MIVMNLLTTIQTTLGYPALNKISPNIQSKEYETPAGFENRKAQALITSVLAGIYKLAKSETGLKEIAVKGSNENWVDIIFEENKEALLDKIVAYAFLTKDTAEFEMNKIAARVISLVRENTKPSEDNIQIAGFIASQRDNILPYLPPELHLGDFLNDTTIDDNSHKMRGPISSLMHKIESGFSNNETQEKADNKHITD